MPDVDECLQPNACVGSANMSCENIDGSFLCNCGTGFRMFNHLCLGLYKYLSKFHIVLLFILHKMRFFKNTFLSSVELTKPRLKVDLKKKCHN